MKLPAKMALFFALTWGLSLLYSLFGMQRLPFFIYGLGMMWIPGLCALAFSAQEKIRLSIFAPLSWNYLSPALKALGLIFVVFLASLPLGHFIGFEGLRQQLPAIFRGLQPIYFAPVALLYLFTICIGVGISINMLSALGEELMWRGYLWEKLKHLGLGRASLVIGVLWGLWYAPVIFLFGLHYPTLSGFGWVIILVFCISLTPILTLFRARGKSIVYPAIFHGTMNALSPSFCYFFRNPNSFLIGITGVVGIFIYAAFSVLAIVGWQKRIRQGENRNTECHGGGESSSRQSS
ncbi:MAG: type II CAAX prenyl endopeptidase Rce1 family protein [Chlamydiales bacterium]